MTTIERRAPARAPRCVWIGGQPAGRGHRTHGDGLQPPYETTTEVDPVTHPQTATTTIARSVLLVIGATALAIGLLFANPAAAQFVDREESSDGTEQTEVQEAPTERVEEQEAAPTGGVDAGFGGAADQGTGLGAPHALALTLVAFALAGHVANVRRTAPVRA